MPFIAVRNRYVPLNAGDAFKTRHDRSSRGRRTERTGSERGRRRRRERMAATHSIRSARSILFNAVNASRVIRGHVAASVELMSAAARFAARMPRAKSNKHDKHGMLAAYGGI